MFIIDKDVFFNEEGGHLENQTADVSVMMAASTRRLLEVLILNQGNPVTRDSLFKTVWDDNGMRSSNSNLNQYISILRKQLGQVGLPDDAVITIPRVGFMFNPEIEVCHENPPAVVPPSRMHNIFRHFISGPLYYPVFTVSVLLLCISVFFIYYDDSEPEAVTLSALTGYPPECHVYALPGVRGVKKMEPIPFIAENCDKDSVDFIFKHSGTPDDSLIVTCEKRIPGYFILCHNRREGK